MCKRKWWLLLPVLAFAGLTAALLWVCLGPDSGFVIPDQILICLDPGHGGSDPGAVLGDRLEKDDNLKMALAVRDALERHGFENLSVMLTREDDTDLELQQRVDIANSAGATLFISFHRNSGGGGLVSGHDAQLHTVRQVTQIADAALCFITSDLTLRYDQ